MITRGHVFHGARATIATIGMSLFFASSMAGEVISDDLIINGSLCVGAGCVDGMDFAFSTVQLQAEDNRLQFKDPNFGDEIADWQIIANDSEIDGESYLGVAYVKGLKGKKTTKERKETQKGRKSREESKNSEDTDKSSGTGREPAVIFRIKAGAPEDSLVVLSNGNLGVATATPAEQLQVAGDADVKVAFADTLVQTSSRTLKHDVEVLAPDIALAAVAGLRPVTFRRKAHPEEQSLGFIAEEVSDLIASPGRTTIAPMKFVAALTGAAQAQGESIEAQRRDIAELSARLDRLEQAMLARKEASRR